MNNTHPECQGTWVSGKDSDPQNGWRGLCFPYRLLQKEREGERQSLPCGVASFPFNHQAAGCLSLDQQPEDQTHQGSPQTNLADGFLHQPFPHRPPAQALPPPLPLGIWAQVPGGGGAPHRGAARAPAGAGGQGEAADALRGAREDTSRGGEASGVKREEGAGVWGRGGGERGGDEFCPIYLQGEGSGGARGWGDEFCLFCGELTKIKGYNERKPG